MQKLPNLFTASLLLGGLCLSSAVMAAQVPLIAPQLISVVEQKKCLQEAEQEFCAEIRMLLETTSVPWLDQALLTRMDLNPEPNPAPAADFQTHLQQIKQQAEAWLTESYTEIAEARAGEEPYFVGYEQQDSIRFIAQRHHLASFKQFSYGYSGGAHGMYNTSYLLFDLNSQKQLLLPDILQRFAEAKLLEVLRARYQETYAEYAQNWLGDKVSEQAETLLTDNFVFNEQGLIFSYAPYVLGPFAEGEIRLTLDYSELSELLKPEYVLNN